MSFKRHHGNSRQGDSPGARSKHSTLGKKASLKFRGFLLSGFLCFLLTIPSHSTPTRPRPSQPHSKNKPHTLRALGVTVSCLYGHGCLGPEGFSSTRQCWWDQWQRDLRRAVMQAQNQENPRQAPTESWSGALRGYLGERPLGRGTGLLLDSTQGPGRQWLAVSTGRPGYWPRASRPTRPRTRNST